MSNNLDIFLSYTNDFEKTAKNLTKKLAELNINSLYNDWSLSCDSIWLKELESYLPIIKTIVVFVGKNGLEVNQELELELFNHETILGTKLTAPVIIIGESEPTNLPYFIKNYTFVQLDFKLDIAEEISNQISKSLNESYINNDIIASTRKNNATINSQKIEKTFLFLITFSCVLNWIKFAYIAIKVKNYAWLAYSSFYFIITSSSTLILFFVDIKSNIFKVFIAVLLLNWIVSIIHFSKIKKAYFIRLKLLNKTKTKLKLKQIKKLKEEYTNKLLIKDSKEYDELKNFQLNKVIKNIKNTINNDKYKKIDKDNTIIKIDKLTNEIYEILNTVKKDISNNNKLIILESFVDELKSYKHTVDNINNTYKSSYKYLKNNENIKDEIDEIENSMLEIDTLQQSEFKKILTVKRNTLYEVHEIKKSMQSSETTLIYILSCVKNIQAIMEKNKLLLSIDNKNIDELNDYMESFTENVDNSIKSIKA